TERPQDGLDAVQTRLRKGKVLHDQLANYFKERAHIEDMYAKSITKAFQKHFVTDTHALGTFTAPWEKLNEETVELATLHGQFSLRIANEIERPLRDYARTQSEWQNLSLAETNCNRIAKEFDEKQLKVNKYTKAVEKVSGKKAEAAEQKLIDYTKQLESTRTAWRLEGPVVLQISGRTVSSVAEFDALMDQELFASELTVNMHPMELHDGASIVSGVSNPSNGDTVGNLEPHGSNGTRIRGLTGSSQLSNVSYYTDHSVAQSKAGSIDHTKTIDPQEQVRSGSASVLGSALDVPTNHVDAEGFSIPPPDHGPWSDAGASSIYDDERSETSSFSQVPKMHLEIRQDLVTESNDEARAALERVASTLKQSKTVIRRPRGRREVRSMYQSEDNSSAFNSFQSSPLSTNFTTDGRDASTTPPSMHSPSSRVFFNTSAPHLQTSTSFSPAMSRASTLGIPSIPSPSQPQFSHSIPPTPPLTLANGSGSGPTSILGTGQLLSAEPEAAVISAASAPASPLSPIAPSISMLDDSHMSANGAAVPAQSMGQRQTWAVSVIEKVHAHTQGGEISKLMVTGEVVLHLENTETTADPQYQPDKKAVLRLDHLESLEKHIPNPGYLAAKDGAKGVYWVDLEALSHAVNQMQQDGQVNQGQGVVVLKYQVRTTDEEAKQTMIPLLIHPAWKCEAHQTSLLINYKANAQCKLSQQHSSGAEDDATSVTSTGLQLNEVSFLVPVSGEVTNVQSRPTGIWNSESNKMFWDVDNVTMSNTAPEPHKLLARFEMNPTGGPSQPSATAVKFRAQGGLLSDLVISMERHRESGVEEAEEGVERDGGAFGSVRLQVQSGRYLAMA
ncbi:hypothetical protein BG011_010085, partial [Mortierella polycephala]